jgi:hypothetical protein
MNETNTNNAALTPERIDHLKERCSNMLRTSYVKPSTVTGKRMIHAFWVGVLETTGGSPSPFITICLMSGRYSDLVK